jgi:hypothetical protein
MVLVAQACGGDSASSSVSLTDLPPKLASAYCSALSGCYGPVASALTNGADCAPLLTERLREGLSPLEDAVAQGTVLYDGTKVDACLTQLGKVSCELSATRLGTLCPGLIQGTKKAGDACTLDEECGAALFCDESRSCPGACTPLLSEGQSCSDNDACQNGLSCSNGACSKPIAAQFVAAEGEACNPDPARAEYCKSGLSCALTGISSGPSGAQVAFTCEKPPTDGSCHVGIPEECPSGQYCEGTTGSVTGTCKLLPTIGAPCARHFPNDTTAQAVCPPNSVCDAGTSTCRAYAHLGEPCSADAECYSSRCKDGQCVAKKCVASGDGG